MDVTVRFDVALLRLRRRDGRALRPLLGRASSACAEVLSAAAVAVSVVSPDGFRFPVGVSDDLAAAGERFQFTNDDGPWRDAYDHGVVVTADEATMSRRWPRLHAQLTRRTPLRAVVSLPMRIGASRVGVVDLYFRSDDAMHPLDLDESRTVVALVAELLVGRDPARSPRWLDATVVSPRNGVLVAIGMLGVTAGLSAELALGRLRTFAMAAGVTVDDVARRVIERTLDVAELARHPA